MKIRNSRKFTSSWFFMKLQSRACIYNLRHFSIIFWINLIWMILFNCSYVAQPYMWFNISGVHCGWNNKRLLKYQDDDGYHLYKSGHIEAVVLANILQPAGFIYVRAKCKPEQRQSAERYTVDIAFHGNDIHSVSCSCVAGWVYSNKLNPFLYHQ